MARFVPCRGGGAGRASGFRVVEATDPHDAVVMSKRCPGLASGGSIRVYQAVQPGGPMAARCDHTSCWNQTGRW